MAAEREPPTATDYVVTALSPVLVMLMVGSLVFFLVEVLYEGQYSGRLLYTLFFFVAGAVLVARIAIETDPGRASLYGAFLGGATYLALLAYVEYPGGKLRSVGWLVNLGLMVLIWCSAHKLTWDCTHIDERQKGAGRGLLSAAGLDADAKDEPNAPLSRDAKRSESPAAKRKKKRGKHDSRLWDWIERYQKHREARRAAPHTPGVWVVYFALAALPLFALGQSLISPGDAARRQVTFLQMVVYVGSALGLLVTTSLLGLRRYLRQRKAKIPMTLAGGWLALGGLFIAVFLVIAAFLPRPHSEVPWFGIERAGKSNRDASSYAFRKDSSGKGEGAEGNQTKAGDGSASGKDGKPGGGSKGDKGSGGKGQGGKGGGDGKGDQSGGDQQGDGGGKDGSDGEAKKDEANKGRESRGEAREGGEAKDSAESRDGSRGTSQSSPQLGGALEKVAEFAKWLVFAVVAVLVVVVVVLAVLRYLAPFTLWAQRLLDAIRNWWANLFSGKEQSAHADRSPGDVGPQRPPPFAEFSNPFADGTARGRDPAELTAYTFDALDSWAWDRDCGRTAGETPLEFVSRLREAFPDIDEALTAFAGVYAPVVYSHAAPPAKTLPALEEMWEGMLHGVAAA